MHLEIDKSCACEKVPAKAFNPFMPNIERWLNMAGSRCSRRKIFNVCLASFQHNILKD